MAFILTSRAFTHGGTIPRQYTCDDSNIPPPLAWAGAPAGTQGFALILDDPDAPRGTFTHLLVYDIPSEVGGLESDDVGTSLLSDFGRSGYGGPCPPRGHGTHHYHFTLYAVDVHPLPVHGRHRADLERALRSHGIGVARLTGTYARAS
jgi:Raf kinase inhibitor-like YbhB/YbcL family protein